MLYWSNMQRLSKSLSLDADGSGTNRVEREREPEPEPSWSERQVAKVKQRKTWSTQLAKKVPLHPHRLLERSFSTIVNVSDDSDANNTDHPDDPAADYHHKVAIEPNSPDNKLVDSGPELPGDNKQESTAGVIITAVIINQLNF